MFKKILRSIGVLLLMIMVVYAVIKGTGMRTTDYSPLNPPTKPYTIGSVDTAFQRIGPDHKIEVGGVPDPKIEGITCFYSRAKSGGVKGGLGIAEDTSDASVACRQTGPITFKQAIKSSEEIWNESTSLLFKKLRIVRFYDKATNSLIYMVYSDKLIDGSPKNAISAIALDTVQPLLQ
ncbi:hypothetical protein XF24_00909 [candidate division SR1 bacterium Aalborg_AAW-1]|nr:hypothetical protein XF24_00909 [candidate division SR1 bacterium Aalborg_AAW-1]